MAIQFLNNPKVGDNVKIEIGASSDLQIYHDGSNSYIDDSGTGDLYIRANNLRLSNADGSGQFINANNGGAVELYHNNNKRFETTAGGTSNTGTIDSTGTITVTGANGNVGINTDTGKLLLGASYDLQIYHDGSNSYIDNQTDNLFIVNKANDKDIRFQTDNGAGGTTTYFTIDGLNGINQFSKNVSLPDNVIAKFGNSSDLQIYHDGSNSYIKDSGTGTLNIQGSTQVLIGGANGEVGVQYVENAGVGLRHNNVAKLTTTSTGVSLTGNITATDNSYQVTLIDTSTSNRGEISVEDAAFGFYADRAAATADSSFFWSIDNANKMEINLLASNEGQLRLNDYGPGNITGTVEFILGVDSNGNVIETSAGGSGTVTGTGAATRVAFWSSTTALSSDANLYWDNTNDRLGIGTTSPSEKLNVVGVTKIEYNGIGLDIENTAANGADTGVRIRGARNGQSFATGNLTSFLRFSNYDDNTVPNSYDLAEIGAGMYHTNDDTGYFRIMTNNGTAMTKALDIDNTQNALFYANVGIGTTAPSSLLHLSSASSPTLRIVDTTNGVTLLAFSQDSNAHVGTFSNTDLIFDTNSNERMRILNGGDVKINTTVSTLGKLSVRSQSGANTFYNNIQCVPSDATTGGLFLGSNLANDAIMVTGAYYANAGNYTPTATSASIINMFSGNIVFRANDSLTVGTNYVPTERMRIKSTGQIQFNAYGVEDFTGTTAYLLAVEADGDVIEVGASDLPGGPYLPLAGGTLTGALTVQDSGTGINIDTAGHASLRLDRASTSYDNNIMFQTAGDIKFRIWQDGDADYLFIRDDDNGANMVTFKKGGNVGIGVGNPDNALDINSSYTNSVHIQGTGSHNLYSYHDSAGVGWATGAGTSFTNLVYMDSSNNIRTYTNGTEKMCITSGGDVGIAVTAPVTKLQVGGTSTTDGSINIGGIYGVYNWTRSYVASNTNIERILNQAGNALANGGAYRVTGHISGTGTDQSSRAVFWNQNGTWYCNVTAQSGNNSNNIEFLVYDGLPSVKTYHANNYTIRVWHERIELAEETGTDNSRHYFGADAYMSQMGDDISMAGPLNANGSSGKVGIGTSSPTTKLYVDGGESTFNRGNSVGTIATFRGQNAVKAVIGTATSYFTGNVGIGTTAPSSQLNVHKAALSPAVIELSNTVASGNDGVVVAQIKANTVNEELTRIETQNSSDSHDNGNMLFYNRNGYTNTFSESMRITGEGNIGIGVTSNSAEDTNNGVPKLQVNTSTAPLGEFPLAARFTCPTDAGDNSGVSVLINSGNDRGLMISAGRAVGNTSKVSLNVVKNDGNEIDTITMIQDGTGGSTANVGIGTTAPAMPLHVSKGGTSAATIGIGQTGTAVARLYMDASNGDFSGGDYMWIGQNNDLSGEIQMTQGAGAFNIKTQPSGILTTRFTVLQNGNIGIGLTSPSFKLDVRHGASAGAGITTVARFSAGTGSSSGDGTQINLMNWNDHYGGFIRTVNTQGTPSYLNPRLEFGLNYNNYLAADMATKMVILGDGKVGIGTTAPNAPLHIQKDSNASDVMVNLKNLKYGSTNTSGDTRIQFGWLNHEAAFFSAYKDGTVNRTGFRFVGEVGFNVPVELMRITSAGKVGIGTTAPTGDLSVGSTTTTSGDIHLRTTKTAVTLTPSNTAAGGFDIDTGFVSGGQGPMTLSIGGSEKMRIDSAGKIGIGSTAPTSTLTVGSTVDNQTLSLGQRFSANASGRTVLIEGVANSTNGEGSGRIFFTEHNSTTAAADKYGLSLVYSGDTNPAFPSGATPGLGNAQWALMRHDNSLNGATIMYGSRTDSNVYFANNIYMPNALLHVGDTNTYIQFHAADQFRVVTGGSERFEVTNTQITANIGEFIATGDVGVGITSPNTKLHVSSDGGHPQVRFQETGNGEAVGLRFQAKTSAEAQVYADIKFDPDSSELIINNPYNSGTQSLTVDSSSNVLVGADLYIPNKIIHTGDTNTYMQFNAADSWRVVVGNVETIEANVTRTKIASGTNEILRLATTGATQSPYVSFYQSTTRRSFIQHNNSGANLDIVSEYGGIRLLTGTNGTETEKMVIQADGDVGIGVTNPVNKLQVGGKIYSSGDIQANSELRGATLRLPTGGTSSANEFSEMQGFIDINVNGTVYVIPYYEKQ